METKRFKLVHREAIRRAIQAVEESPEGYIVTIQEPTRSLEQNALLWALLTDVSEQVDWYGRKLSATDWKHMFTASLKKQDNVPGIDGGVVVLGQSTSQMTKKEFSSLVELIYAFGAEHGVVFIDEREVTA